MSGHRTIAVERRLVSRVAERLNWAAGFVAAYTSPGDSDQAGLTRLAEQLRELLEPEPEGRDGGPKMPGYRRRSEPEIPLKVEPGE